MRKGWILGLGLLLAASGPALASSRPHSVSTWEGDDQGGSDGSFSAATLTGTYEFEASGFADDGKPGEVTVLGTLAFDGTSAVTGNLIFTRGDTAQWSCADAFTTGTYTVTPGTTAPGLGTLQFPLTGGGNAGVINFGLLVPSAEGKKAQVIETDSGNFGQTTPPIPALTICGAPNITSMVLKGSLHRLGGDD